MAEVEGVNVIEIERMPKMPFPPAADIATEEVAKLRTEIARLRFALSRGLSKREVISLLTAIDEGIKVDPESFATFRAVNRL